MSYTKEHILVFLAYISDVEPEVNAAKDIVEAINRSHEKLEIELDLRIWKDVQAEYGNPQEKINRDFVEKCDVFIGLIWKKWGTPTGQSDCGFIEEFNIAERRYNETRKPTILLYAKAANEQEIKEDEKEGYNKIKEFKNEIISEHKGFLIPFETIDSWKNIIRARLAQYVVEKHVSSPGNKGEPKGSHAVSATAETNYEVMEKVRTPKEIQNLISDLSSYKSKIDEISSIEDFKKTRLFLLSSAIFYDTNLYEILGNHEIHLLYLHRLDIKPIGLEAKLILRTIIADRYNLRTGWFWLKNIGDSGLRAYASSHFMNDPNKEVRLGALSFIDKVWLQRYKNQLIKSIGDNEDEIKIRALEICAVRGDESYINTIVEYLPSPNKDVAKAAWTAKFAILSRTNPDSAIKFLQEFESNRGTLSPYLEQIKDSISSAKLRELINDIDTRIKVIAYEELIKRQQLSTDEIRVLLDTQIIDLRKLAYLSLIELGEKFSPENVKEKWPVQQGLLALLPRTSDAQLELVISKIYQCYTEEELVNEIDWLSQVAPMAYLSMGIQYYDSFKEQLLSDLENDFKGIKDKYIENFKPKLIVAIKRSLSKDPKLSDQDPTVIDSIANNMLENQMSEILEEFKELDKSIKKQFILSALKILAFKETLESLRYARKNADSNDKEIQSLVIQIIAKHGGSEDVPTLIQIAFDNYGSTKIEAVRLALKYSKFDKAVIQQFISSGEEAIIKACLSYDLHSKSNIMIEDAKVLLMHKSDDIRIPALSYLANILSNRKLLELLNNYLAGSTYYYNVVCWLDRILFAPAKIRKIYKQELLSIVKSGN